MRLSLPKSNSPAMTSLAETAMAQRSMAEPTLIARFQIRSTEQRAHVDTIRKDIPARVLNGAPIASAVSDKA